MDSYARPREGVIYRGEREIKRSRFICLISRATDEAEARGFIDQVRRQFPDARHHCSAYIFAVPGAQPVERSSDDGEPSGTAGRPMLEQLKGSGLLDVAAVVVRYFGGIKLGAGGLVHAYSNAVGDVLPRVESVTRARRQLYRVATPHAAAGKIEAELRARGVEVLGTEYGAHVTLRLACPPGGSQKLAATLAAVTSGAAELIADGTSWVELAG
ncbi:hypothetical protein CATYP_07170 [Corynebacterium atypicum]|uniref:YigZ family protein n=1 Tax=Corynebacterium atypicum TaxID=191610 RepID=A0ABM5QNP7_9CORY|nr:YigZ family protein [Corynebacterium atypicum]AIG64405.1 hypothetical protein CATYP_07170 [Corynebacterium atypicum]